MASLIRYAEHVGKDRWKGVTWGMLPLHTSGIIACTYHLFYNDPAISWCVALQAGMTCVGNTTLALACLRLALASGWTWQLGLEELADTLAFLSADLAKRVRGNGAVLGTIGRPSKGSPIPNLEKGSASSMVAKVNSAEAGGASALPLVGWEDLGDAWSRDSSLAFLGKLAALSGGLAYGVKYAPALLPAGVREAWETLPEGVISALALAVIVLPTALNVAKWQQRSAEDAEFVGDF